jgi:SAM-dependent methyltransferase
MRNRSRKRIRKSGREIDYRVVGCEQLPFEEDSFDCVVSTWTLCSIVDVSRALSEVYRVLKPGGRFLFLEHGLSPDPGIRKWQRRLNWLEMHLADGCRLDRDIKGLVAGQPFATLHVDEFYLKPLPGTHGYTYRGCAVK